LNDKYLLALLNSSLYWYYFKQKLTVLGDPEKGGRLRFFTQFVVDIPIKTISKKTGISNRRTKKEQIAENMRENIESLATQMLALHEHLAAIRSEADKLLLERQIKATDQKINHLVYELYNLTEDEIRIIEET